MIEYFTGETHRPGRIEVVCGSMFSGKTEELIRRMRRAKFAKQRVEIFKPAIDVRYSDDDMVSHCYWKNDEEIIAFERKKEFGTGYYLMRDKTQEWKHLWTAEK